MFIIKVVWLFAVFFECDREIRLRDYTHWGAGIRFNSLTWENIKILVFAFSFIDPSVA